MARYGFEGTDPDVHEDAHVTEGATLVGDVSVAADASVWPGAVLRGDVAPVVVGAESHVGDGAILHAAALGDRVMVGHGAVVNDAEIGDGALVGFNATVAGGRVGARSVVAAGTVVPEEFEIPAESFARGVPARVTPLSETTVDAADVFEAYSSGAYTDLAERHEELFD